MNTQISAVSDSERLLREKLEERTEELNRALESNSSITGALEEKDNIIASLNEGIHEIRELNTVYEEKCQALQNQESDLLARVLCLEFFFLNILSMAIVECEDPISFTSRYMLKFVES